MKRIYIFLLCLGWFALTTSSLAAAGEKEEFDTTVGKYVIVDTIDGSKVVGRISASEKEHIVIESNLFPKGRKILRYTISGVEEIDPIKIKKDVAFDYRNAATLATGYYFGFTVGDIADKLPNSMAGYLQYTQGLDGLLWKSLIDGYRPHPLYPIARYEINIQSFSQDNDSIFAVHNYIGPNWIYRFTPEDMMELSLLAGISYFDLETDNTSYPTVSSNSLVILAYKRIFQTYSVDLQYRFAVLYDEKPTLMNMGASLGFSFILGKL